MKLPYDLLSVDVQNDTDADTRKVQRTQESAQDESRQRADADTPRGAMEYGRSVAGLADAIKARNKKAVRQGVRPQDKARARSRDKLSRTLGRIFEAQENPGQDDDVVVRRPVKKPEDV